MLRHVKPKWQPLPVTETCLAKSSIKIANRQGERAPPCLAPVVYKTENIAIPSDTRK